jgi:mannose-6-phosphate isomerase-like protein (cupin superfamily)
MALYTIENMNIYVDIDNTICITDDSYGVEKYNKSLPIKDKIEYINDLYDKGNNITYWTSRGNSTGIDQTEFTESQLKLWGCKYHKLILKKPSYDLLIDDKTMHPNNIICNLENKKIHPEIVKKGWGHEIIFVNNDLYCGKILHFKKDAKFSMHFHMLKKETWYVSSGKYLFKYIDTKTADTIELLLDVGDTITNKSGRTTSNNMFRRG